MAAPPGALPPAPPLDEAAVAEMARGMMLIAKAHMEQLPPQPARVFETLNALAFVVAAVVGASGDRAGAFFDQALAENYQSILEHQAAGHG